MNDILSNPGLQQFIGNIPLFILGLVALILILKYAKNLVLKKGDAELSINAKSDILAPVIKVVTEYADWKSEYQKEYINDFKCIDKEAKQIAITAIKGHLSILSQEYTAIINRSKQPKKAALTKQFLRMFLAIIYPDILNLIMTIYENNHLYDKDDEYISQLVSRRYEDLRNIYRGNIQKYWFSDLLPYIEFTKCLQSCENQFMDILKNVIQSFRNLSSKKNDIDKKYYELDINVKAEVNKSYKLPVDAYAKLYDIYNAKI